MMALTADHELALAQRMAQLLAKVVLHRLGPSALGNPAILGGREPIGWKGSLMR